MVNNNSMKNGYNHKLVSTGKAVSLLRNGSRVFLGSGCGEPQHLIRSMIEDKNIEDIMLYQVLPFTLSDFLDDENFLARFSLKVFLINAFMQKAAAQGKLDYIPVYLSEVPMLFKTGQIGADIAMIQISPPDSFGFASLGVSIDVTREAVKHSKTVIAQVNPLMPRTLGNSFIHVDDIDYLVYYEQELPQHVADNADPDISRRIAFYVSELIDDGSTFQIGYGQLSYSLLKYLNHKNDLGVHTQMITDGYIPLFEKGIITNRKKTLLPDMAVAAFCMGTRKIYDYVDNNPGFFFHTADFVSDPAVIAENDNFISISSAFEIDLTGQACSDSGGRQLFSGTGDQSSFIRGSGLSKGGFSVIVLPSTSGDGKVSRIVPFLGRGAGVATLRADVNYVVTEYGVAQLHGKSIYQRVMELTQIAHPDFREDLIKSAKKNNYIFADQLPPIAEDLIFLEKYKTQKKLKNDKIMSVRPLLPSDEIAYRNFFYSLKQSTIYLRFFRKIKVFSRKMAQAHWAFLDYRKNISILGIVPNKGNKEIIAIGTYVGDNDSRAEIAFIVREDFQGTGITTCLIKQLEKIALENGFTGFKASVLPANKVMLHVLKKVYPDADMNKNADEVYVIMDF